MDPFRKLTSVAASLPAADVDTDIIFPARFLLHTEKVGLGRFAFFEWRYFADGGERPDFVLSRPAFRGAQILVAGRNFGCGSSREQAPWALYDLGVRCVIAPSFGEIFFSNCFRNGMLPVVVTPEELALLQADADTARPITVDLETQQITCPSGETVSFEIEPWRRDALLNGWDEIDGILNRDLPAIDAFEAARRRSASWLNIQA